MYGYEKAENHSLQPSPPCRRVPLLSVDQNHVLRRGELFVMNPAAPDSFDGRYFGVLRITQVIGRATPVWTDEAGNGDHVWFADPRATETSPTTN